MTPQFPFVSELPKREKRKVENVWDRLAQMREAVDAHGMLIPPVMVASLLNVSRQRVHQFTQDGRLKMVQVNGQPMITEDSVVELAKAERKAGRPFKVNEPTVKNSIKLAMEVLNDK